MMQDMDEDKDGVVVVELEGVGIKFVNGLWSSYDPTYPEEIMPLYQVSLDEFTAAINKINEALMDHWPCLACQLFSLACLCCTCGLSLFCSNSMVAEAEERAQLQIQRINKQSNFQSKGIKWKLVSFKGCKRTSWVQINLPKLQQSLEATDNHTNPAKFARSPTALIISV